MAVDSACANRLLSLKFVGDTLSVSPLIGLVTLAYDLLTSNLVRVIAREVDNLVNNLTIFMFWDWGFSFST